MTSGALAKCIGIETEYGIFQTGTAQQSQAVASSMLLRAYASHTSAVRGGVVWDYADETPTRDARLESPRPDWSQVIETAVVNSVLTNGARLYVDHAHPEYSTPEVTTALDAVRYDVAGEVVAADAMVAVREWLPDDQEIVLHKNNSDGKGNSYGTHENYFMRRDVAFTEIVRGITPFLVARQLVVGAGKLGWELPGAPFRNDRFQVSARADFFEEEVGLETTVKRPIVNTRDEPHADPQRFRRLHVIIGDANMSQWATWLKVGATSLVLCAIETGLTRQVVSLRDPVGALRTLSRDPDLGAIVELSDGRTVRGLELLEVYFDVAHTYVEHFGADAVGGTDAANELLSEWRLALDQLAVDPLLTRDRVEWVAKRRLLDAYCDRNQLGYASPEAHALMLQFCDLRPGKGLAGRVGLRTLVSEPDARACVATPPPDTRAYFRGQAVGRFGADVEAANWDSLVLRRSDGRRLRVPMTDPTRGTRELVGPLFDEARNVDELIERLANSSVRS